MGVLLPNNVLQIMRHVMYLGGEGEASVEQAQRVHLAPVDGCRSGLAAGIPRNLAAQNCPDGFIVAAIDGLLTKECGKGIKGFFEEDAFRQTLLVQKSWKDKGRSPAVLKRMLEAGGFIAPGEDRLERIQKYITVLRDEQNELTKVCMCACILLHELLHTRDEQDELTNVCVSLFRFIDR